MVSIRFLLQSLIFLVPALSAFIQDTGPGMAVPDVKLTDVYDKEKNIPFLGKKAFLLFYIDPDRQHIIDPLTKVLDSQEYNNENYVVVSVIDCKDTWIPYVALRTGAKREQKLYPDSPILFDRDHLLSTAWKFGECDNTCVVAIIGKDSKIKFIQKLKSEDECRNIVSAALEVFKEETR